MLPMSCPNEETLKRQLFDRQVERLLERGYHRTLGWTELDFRLCLNTLRNRLGEIEETNPDNLRFLIVVSHGMLPIARQMELLVVAKKHGHASLDWEKLINSASIGNSEFPYLVCDVDDGARNVGGLLRDVTREIRHAGRYGLTVEEGIALAVQIPDILLRQSIALADSDYMRYTPELWLSSGGPALSYDFPQSQKEGRAVPSCRRLSIDR